MSRAAVRERTQNAGHDQGAEDRTAAGLVDAERGDVRGRSSRHHLFQHASERCRLSTRGVVAGFVRSVVTGGGSARPDLVGDGEKADRAIIDSSDGAWRTSAWYTLSSDSSGFGSARFGEEIFDPAAAQR